MTFAKKSSGFTVVELIITLVIMGILFGTGFMYMSGYLPKQRLNSSASMLLNVLRIEQSRAMTKSGKYGVFFLSNGEYACGFRDLNNDFQCTGCDAACTSCSCSGEMAGEMGFRFKSDVTLLVPLCQADSPPGTGNVLDTIIFDFKGFSYKKLVAPATTGTLQNFEIFLKSSHSGVGVREVEVNSGGSIELIKLGEAGNLAGQANVAPCN